MNSGRLMALTVMFALGLAGCSLSGSQQGSSTLAGGSAVSGYAPETYSLGLIGGAIGEELDVADRRTAMDAEFRALEYGRAGGPVEWRSKNGRIYGAVVTGARYQVNDFACREITHTLYINDQPQVAHGTACRQPDGTWKSVG